MVRAALRSHRFVSYRPLVELLEARLPPGDAVFGALLGGAMLPAERATGLVPVVSAARPGPARSLIDDTDWFATLRRSVRTDADPEPSRRVVVAAARFSEASLTDTGRPLTSVAPAILGRDPSAGAALSVLAAPPAAPTPSLTVFASLPPANYQLDQAVAALIPPTGDDGGAGIQSSGVRALFNLDHPHNGPFPSNVFTVPDRTMNTNRRVNLPLPDCKVYVSDCEDLAVINELDGFNLQPRLSVPFSGPIDVDTATSETVFLISLGSTVPGQGYMPRGTVVGINQIVWDVETNTLHVESDELLAQHTRFALIVTNGVRDADGDRVEASQEFRRFRETAPPAYRRELEEAIQVARRLGIRERQMVTASVFTTQSATAVLEKIRDQIRAVTPEPADFLLGPKGERTVFDRDQITSRSWIQQTGDNPPAFGNPVTLNMALLQIIPDAVGQIAYGKYLSPDYQTPEKLIPQVGTRTGTPAVQGMSEIYFNLYLPASAKPADGWPVAIYVSSGDKEQTPQRVAASMAAQGIATISINLVGNGFGPLSTLTVTQTGAEPLTFLAGGRGVDLNGDHTITATEGRRVRAPQAIIHDRDSQRQTVADLMQLVREVEVGMDVDGDGTRDVDPSRIYAFGHSFGSHIATQFLAVEPSVLAGVLYATGGPIGENRRVSPVNRPDLGSANFGSSLATRVPSLINSPGITSIEGVNVNAPRFHENKPLRNGIPLTVSLADGTSLEIRSPVINTVAGAMAIQEYLDNLNWATMSGQNMAYAPHLRKAPLPGVPAKSVIVLFAKGDQQVTNPATTALIRAGDLADRTTFFRNDLAYAEDNTVPKDPHPFALAIDNVLSKIALATQGQIATFFASDGKTIIHPEPKRFFEVPIQGPLPEELNYIP